MLYIYNMGKAYWYLTNNGRSPVEEAIEKLSKPDQAKIYANISLLEKFGNRLGMPAVRKIEGKLKELRITISPGKYRIFYFFYEGENFYLLHGILKKVQKTPKKDINTAKKRMKTILRQLL